MNPLKHLKQKIKDESGILTLDLVFALSLVLGCMVIVLVLSLTLSTIEVSQYVAFSTSRAFYAGHISTQRQEQLAKQKFASLLDKPGIAALVKSRWFQLKFTGAGDYSESYSDVSGRGGNPLQGTEVQIQAKILAFNVPFFGQTADSDRGLETRVNSFLGREASSEECLNMTAERFRKIKETVNLGGFSIGDTGYFVITDNGC